MRLRLSLPNDVGLLDDGNGDWRNRFDGQQTAGKANVLSIGRRSGRMIVIVIRPCGRSGLVSIVKMTSAAVVGAAPGGATIAFGPGVFGGGVVVERMKSGRGQQIGDERPDDRNSLPTHHRSNPERDVL